MNIVFQFFPLEGKCNAVVAKDLHTQACALSYIAAHDPDKFLAIHDEIFANFAKTRSEEWVMNLARKYGVEESLTDENTKKIVHDIINTGMEYKPTSDKYKYGIRSTPTIILNERIVIGTFPKAQLRAIFKAILRKEQKEKDVSEEFIENWK
jgi:protein-disulfide isomerase